MKDLACFGAALLFAAAASAQSMYQCRTPGGVRENESGARSQHSREQMAERQQKNAERQSRALAQNQARARIELLDTLRRLGACSIYALAKEAARNYSNVHTDIVRLEALGLVERDEQGCVLVPYESVEILVPLAQEA